MKLPIDVFTEWAKDGRDERMARGHADSVNSMLDFALEGQVDPDRKSTRLNSSH